MVNFEVLIDEDAQVFLDHLPEKTQESVRNKLRLLEEDPFPGTGGNKSYSSPRTKDFTGFIFPEPTPPFIIYSQKRKL